ncbi:MAG: winged helix-turn-helix domain-containing protein, partial [Caldilineaceae bacterium]|nr:winged helix-turn-helix domain-containing protein [Caldilineaceae bacterium]
AELAAALGTVREVVSRSLSELQRLDLIEVDARRIRIVNRQGLEDLAGF